MRLTTTIAALLIIAGIVLFSGFQLEMSLIILATAVSKSIEALSDAFYGLFMQQERLDRIAKSMIMKGPLSLLGLGLGFYLSGSVFWAVVGLVIARGIIMLGYDVRNVNRSIYGSSEFYTLLIPKKFPRPRWDKATMTRLFWLTLPLGFVTMLISFNLNIPRYFVEGYLGSYQLGIFAAITAFQKAAPTVVQALGRSAAPRLSKYFAAGKAGAFRTLSIKLIGMGLLLGLAGVFVAWIAGDKILNLFYGPEYALTGVFILVMVASGTDYLATILLFIITSARSFKIQLPLHLLTTATVAIGCYFLVPSQGLIGAALALILADIVRLGGTLGAALHSFGTLRKVPVNLGGEPQL